MLYCRCFWGLARKMMFGIGNNIQAAVADGRLVLVERGLVVSRDFSLEDYVKGPFAYFAKNCEGIKACSNREDFPGFTENFGLMIDARNKAHSALRLYWQDVIRNVLKEQVWNVVAKGIYSHKEMADVLKKEINTITWDSNLFLNRPSNLAIVTTSGTSGTSDMLQLTPDKEAKDAREKYCKSLDCCCNLSLPQIAVYGKDNGLLDRIHTASKAGAFIVLDWKKQYGLW